MEVKIVRLEVIESWSGIYKSLQPPDANNDEVDGSEWLGQLSEWIGDNGRDIYDAHHLFTTFDFFCALQVYLKCQ